MKLRNLSTFGLFCAALAFTFTTASTLHEEPLGQTIASAYLPEAETAAGDAAEHVAVVVADATPVRHAFSIEPHRLPLLPPEEIDTETLWLARCIFSETKRAEEQELVAWVVRNRVETRYRGKGSYRDVVLDPFQFSAFNPESPWNSFYSNLSARQKHPGWARALSIAHYVRHADESLRPFPTTTRHFYSERSMIGRAHPDWSYGYEPVTPNRTHKIDARRFRFYKGVG